MASGNEDYHPWYLISHLPESQPSLSLPGCRLSAYPPWVPFLLLQSCFHSPYMAWRATRLTHATLLTRQSHSPSRTPPRSFSPQIHMRRYSGYMIYCQRPQSCSEVKPCSSLATQLHATVAFTSFSILLRTLDIHKSTLYKKNYELALAYRLLQGRSPVD